MSDLLCFHAFENIYGVPLDMIKESFDEQKVTPVPRLNPVFTGLCNHKGIIYPVLSFSKLLHKNIPDKRCCMLLLHVDKYQLILRMNDVPFIIYESMLTQDMPYDSTSELVKIDRLCMQEDRCIYMLDMKQMLDELSEHILDKSYGI